MRLPLYLPLFVALCFSYFLQTEFFSVTSSAFLSLHLLFFFLPSLFPLILYFLSSFVFLFFLPSIIFLIHPSSCLHLHNVLFTSLSHSSPLSLSIFYLLRYFRFLSPVCLDFMKNLLVKDPSKRMSTGEALRHPFITGIVSTGMLFILLHAYSLIN